jgi:hypothetical protein
LCCSVVRFGRSVVINEYSSFWMFSGGMMMFVFSEWNFCSLLGSVGRDFGFSIKFLIRVVVHWVELFSINWSHCIGVGANVISIA